MKFTLLAFVLVFCAVIGYDYYNFITLSNAIARSVYFALMVMNIFGGLYFVILAAKE